MRRRLNEFTSSSVSGRGSIRESDYSLLERFDLFPKIDAEMQLKTSSGGVISLITAIVVAVLVVWEFNQYFSVDYHDRIAVDALLNEQLKINLNITFHSLGCHSIELIAMDVTGDNQLQFGDTVKKTPVFFEKREGAKCGSCYGAGDEGTCCNTCVQLVRIYGEAGWNQKEILERADQCEEERKKGTSVEQLVTESEHISTDHMCNVAGYIMVNKVAGNFHVAMGHGRTVNGGLVHQFDPKMVNLFNTSHEVHDIWFGETKLPDSKPGALTGVRRTIDSNKSTTAAFQYYLEIVPTEYGYKRYYQYTKTERYVPIGKPGGAKEPRASVSSLPGTFFVYELSPFVVKRTNHSPSFIHLIINLFAIVGGTVGLFKFFDQFVLGVICTVKKS